MVFGFVGAVSEIQSESGPLGVRTASELCTTPEVGFGKGWRSFRTILAISDKVLTACRGPACRPHFT